MVWGPQPSCGPADALGMPGPAWRLQWEPGSGGCNQRDPEIRSEHLMGRPGAGQALGTLGQALLRRVPHPPRQTEGAQAQQAHHLGKMKGVDKVSLEFISNTYVGQTGMRVPPGMKNWKQRGWSRLTSSQNQQRGSRCLLRLLQCPHPLEELPTPVISHGQSSSLWPNPATPSGGPSPPSEVAPVRVSSDLHMTKSLSAVRGG